HAFSVLTHINGAITHVTASWAYKKPVFRTRLEISGDRGLVRHDSEETKSLRVDLAEQEQDQRGTGFPSTMSNHFAPDPLAQQLDDFAQAILLGEPTWNETALAIQSVQVCEAAVESSRNGQPVAIEGLN